MSSTVEKLRETVAVRWRRAHAGERSERRHWATITQYYTAVDHLLDAGRPPDWQSIVDAARPNGSRTTLFTIAGGKAPHTLRRAYAEHSHPPIADIAALMHARPVQEVLIDETKVFTYWPHRVGWMHELRRLEDLSRSAVAESMFRVLLDWADRQPHLARTHDFAPPVCAIEDFMVIHQEQQPARWVHDLLCEAIRSKVGPSACSTEGVLHWVRNQYRPKPVPAHANRQLAVEIDRLTRPNNRVPAQVRHNAVDLMRDAIAVIESSMEP